MKKELMILLSAAVVLWGCNPVDDTGKDDGKDNNGGNVELPEPPEEIKLQNLFVVDFFSTLGGDNGIFTVVEPSDVVSYIAGQTGKQPFVYLFDRAGFVAGESNPVVEIALGTKSQPFFAQNGVTSAEMEGTGMIARYMISDYDGCSAGGCFMSGCTIPLPLDVITPTCIFTAKAYDADGFMKLLEIKKNRLVSDAVVIGTVASSIKKDFSSSLASKFPTVRVSFSGSTGTDYDIFVLVPGSFVCRSIESSDSEELPCYRISIEKLQ